MLSATVPVGASELSLQSLIDEALRNNSEIRALYARVQASKFKICQAKALSDPMVMFGYQNEGTRKLYTFSESPDSQ